ncbi:hypothetical protein [Henriciella marina]|uniref:hypothetical protein n=1 Tax=Henriciella marina TaxID=453851 RepID=UPI000371421D|nr:hypothetical protein [Henriciella marina]
MEDEVDKYSKKRRRLLVAMACAFIVWQLFGFGIFDDFAGGDRRYTGLISILAFAVWIFALARLLWGKGIRGASPGAQLALNDELVKANRGRAFTFGYGATLVAAGIVFAVSLFFEIHATEAAQLILVTGVVAPMFAFARLEGQGA